MGKIAINPAGIQPSRTYSQGIKAGNLLFVAGQVARDVHGAIVGVRDIRRQTEKVFENIKAVLAEAGATLDNVVKMNTYMVDMDLNYPGYSEVRVRLLPAVPPTSTLVEVKSLAPRDALIEIEAVAVLD